MHQRKTLTICCCLVPSLLHNSNVHMDSRSDQEVLWMAVAPAGDKQVSCATTANQIRTPRLRCYPMGCLTAVGSAVTVL